MLCYAAILISENNAEVRRYSAWKKGSDESFIHYLYRMCTEGHTFFDAWLLGAGCVSMPRLRCLSRIQLGMLLLTID